MVYDLIIIGSGPAGLSAVIYAERAKLNTLVIEQNYMSGGQVINTYEVDNYPGLPGINGFDMAMKFREHADKLGAKFVEDTVSSMELSGEEKVVVGAKETYHAKAVLIATGATHRKLAVPGEERLSGMGVSYCATCDGAFFRNKTTAVVGGGDVALEDAIFLGRICEKVYLIHRRDELRGAKTLQEQLFAMPNVEVIWNATVESIDGENKVSSIHIKDVNSGEITEKTVDGVFVAVGILPNDEAYKGQLETDASGYIKAGEDGITSVPGVFVAGDVRTKPLRQVVTAVADGANALTSIERYLNSHK